MEIEMCTAYDAYIYNLSQALQKGLRADDQSLQLNPMVSEAIIRARYLELPANEAVLRCFFSEDYFKRIPKKYS